MTASKSPRYTVNLHHITESPFCVGRCVPHSSEDRFVLFVESVRASFKDVLSRLRYCPDSYTTTRFRHYPQNTPRDHHLLYISRQEKNNYSLHLVRRFDETLRHDTVDLRTLWIFVLYRLCTCSSHPWI